MKRMYRNPGQSTVTTTMSTTMSVMVPCDDAHEAHEDCLTSRELDVELEIEGVGTPGSKATRDDPGESPEIEVTGVWLLNAEGKRDRKLTESEYSSDEAWKALFDQAVADDQAAYENAADDERDYLLDR
jgi:hypothetical protein